MAHRGLKVKVKVMGQADAVGPTSIEGRLFSSYFHFTNCAGRDFILPDQFSGIL